MPHTYAATPTSKGALSTLNMTSEKTRSKRLAETANRYTVASMPPTVTAKVNSAVASFGFNALFRCTEKSSIKDTPKMAANHKKGTPNRSPLRK